MARPRKRLKATIEELLTIAYRDHCVDRVSVAGILALRVPSVSGASPTAGICAHLARGVSVDTSSAGAVFLGKSSQMQAVADDMLDVHDAVLSLPTYYADIISDDSFVLWDDATLKGGHAYDYKGAWDLGYRITGTLANLRIVDRSGVRQDRPRRGYRNGVPLIAGAAEAEAGAPYPAEHVPEAPSRPLHRIEAAPLVIACARAGLRPDLSPAVVERWRPVYRGNRKGAAGYEPVWLTSPRARTLERATYAAWHDALNILVDKLGGLDGYRVLPSEAFAEPWQGETEEHMTPCPGLRLGHVPPCNGEKAR